MGLGIIDSAKTAFVLVDVQEKFIPVINHIDKIIGNCNILVKASQILKIPLIVTEQYPKGLGKTSEKIELPEKVEKIEKNEFSCFDCEKFAKRIKELGVESIVLFGIEAHVCVLQTALSGLKEGLEVHVIYDAVSSRDKKNKKICIERMRQSGVFIASTEIILFQLMKTADKEGFKEIQKLIK